MPDRHTSRSTRWWTLIAATLGLAIVAFCVLAQKDQPPDTPPGVQITAGNKIEPGTTLRIPVSRDTWVSSVEGEENANLGSASQLKTKGIQELALLDLDPAPLRGHTIRRATLHFHCRSQDPQRRLTLSTLASDWTQGRSTTYRPEPGSASFLWAKQNQQPWAHPGSDLTAVICGQGNTIWRFADATPPDEKGWQSLPVEPALLAARLAGLSHGFALIDDVGSEYTRNGEQFTYHPFPNRFISSRESGRALAPYFTIELGQEDHQPPPAAAHLTCRTADTDPAAVTVEWTTPPDAGPAGTIGFHARWSMNKLFNWDSAQPIDRWRIPMAGPPGAQVTMRLDDLDPNPNGQTTITVGIRPVDAAGNPGPVSTGSVTLQKVTFRNPFEEQNPDNPPINPFADEGTPLPRLGTTSVSVIDPLDKVGPVDLSQSPSSDPSAALAKKLIPPRPPAYLRANHLWFAAQRQIRLHAARNEFIAFQLVIASPGDTLTASLTFDDPQLAKVTWHQPQLVNSSAGPLPDPLIPLPGPPHTVTPQINAPANHATTLYAQIYVPHDAPPGDHPGLLRLKLGPDSLDLHVQLRVWNVTLPDHLSFIPQMNCYGLPVDSPGELAYYRLAQLHRTCLNRLAYNWQGRVRDGFLPDTRTTPWDWSNYDRRFSPLFDGSAFADLPRGPIPVEAFYLPIHENWPADVHAGFLPDARPDPQGNSRGYWADEALTPEYRRDFIEGTRRFAQHISDKKWNDTFFEFFLNNKVFFKGDRWSNSSAPWIFDEPVNTQDFWALRWFGLAFHEAVDPVRGNAQLLFRGDISRPQWQRDLLDGVLNVNVVSAGLRRYPHIVMDRKLRWGQLVYEYGGANAIEKSNVQPAAWCVDAWTLGADGVVPWQTIGTPDSWNKADSLALLYPPKQPNNGGPIPSLRLKSFLRGQQDVEYLTLLQQNLDLPRPVLARFVRRALGLKGQLEKANDLDAGTVNFDTLDPAALWSLRVKSATLLDQLRPTPRRRLVDLRPAPWDPSAVPDLGYVTTEPPPSPQPVQHSP